MEKHIPIPIQNSNLLQELKHLIDAKSPDMDKLRRIIIELDHDRFIEYGWLMLRQAQLDSSVWVGLKEQLKILSAKLQTRSITQQRINPNRLFCWLRFKITAPTYAKSYAAVQCLLGQILMDAGLPVAMGLEKSPKLAVKLACHLPLFTEGHNEWADVTLLNPVSTPLPDLPALINLYAPQGLCILEVIRVNNHASSVANLCHRSHWRWTCETKQLTHVDHKIKAFIESKQFAIEKYSKINGEQNIVKIDIRPIFEQCVWDGNNLQFQTSIIPGQAVNPGKILATILGTTTPLSGLARTKLELSDDPRSLQTNKFDIKLHNMYEDAIVLDSGDSNYQL